MAIRTSRTAAAVNTGYGSFMDDYSYLDNYSNASLRGGKRTMVKGSAEARERMAYLRSLRGKGRYSHRRRLRGGEFDISSIASSLSGSLGPMFNSFMSMVGGPAGLAKMGAVGLPMILPLVQKMFKGKNPALKAAEAKKAELLKGLELLKKQSPEKYKKALKNPKVRAVLTAPDKLKGIDGDDPNNPMVSMVAQMIMSKLQQQSGAPSAPPAYQYPTAPPAAPENFDPMSYPYYSYQTPSI